MLVLLEAGVGRLVHERQILIGQVHQLDLELAVTDGEFMEPLPDDRTHPAGAGAADDDVELEHG
jgi:hypothetical protein